jgi:hypothetical protein
MQSHKLLASSVRTGLFLGLAVLSLVIPTRGRGRHNDEERFKIFPPRSTPFSMRLTYEDWSARWWQWGLTIPLPNNPLANPAANCHVPQSGPVFFLAGAVGPVTVDCTVPDDKVLFFPIINVECSNAELFPFFGRNEAGLRACAEAWMNGLDPSSLVLTIDGVMIHDLQRFRVKSPLFAYTVPANNIQGVPGHEVPGGTSPISISDGIWIMLKLPPGKHEIHLEAAIVSGPGAGFSQNTTFELNVRDHD